MIHGIYLLAALSVAAHFLLLLVDAAKGSYLSEGMYILKLIFFFPEQKSKQTEALKVLVDTMIQLFR